MDGKFFPCELQVLSYDIGYCCFVLRFSEATYFRFFAVRSISIGE